MTGWPDRRFLPEYLAKRFPAGAAISAAGMGGTRHRRGSVTDAQQELHDYVVDHHGGHSTYVANDGSMHLTRPGKPAINGTSASVITGEQGDAILTVFSPHWPEIGPTNGDASVSWRLVDGELTRAYLDPLGGVTINAPPATNGDQPSLPGLESSWRPIDLAPVLAEGYVQPRPSVLMRSDLTSDGSLFYDHAINGIHGDSGIGKSWIAVAAIKSEIVNDHDAALIDLEDTAGSIIARLRLLGVSDEAIRRHLHYIRPAEPPLLDDIAHLVGLIAAHAIRLVVLDSLGEAFSLDGVNEDKDVEVAPWVRRNLRPLADAGAAVVVVDHATKAADNPLHPSGSKRKRAAITGASYLITAVVPLVKDDGGVLDITCAKDRHGNYRRGEIVSRLLMTSDIDVRIRFDVPKEQPTIVPDISVATIKAAALVVETCKALGPFSSERSLLGAIGKGAGTGPLRAGIDYAVSRGSIDRSEPGARSAQVHTYLKDLE